LYVGILFVTCGSHNELSALASERTVKLEGDGKMRENGYKEETTC
jgi:hypothetical protein